MPPVNKGRPLLSQLPEDMKTLGRNNLRNFILNEPRHVDEVIELSRKRDICAWSTARSSVKDSDVIVCDYNHVFVESIREASLPSMGIDNVQTTTFNSWALSIIRKSMRTQPFFKFLNIECS